MRRPLSFACGANLLAGTLDAASGATGLLLVTGGTQIRSGAHGGLAALAASAAAAGFPAFRFERRGVGDSDGVDPGFRLSGPDIAAAVAAFRAHCPGLRRIVGFGLCDGATALALHHRVAGIEGLLLANPWVVEAAPDMPPPAAIRRHYAARIASPSAWRRLLGGGIHLGKAVRGLRAAATSSPAALAEEVAQALADSTVPVRILLSRDDATALAFAAEYRGRRFAALRVSGRAECATLASRSHSFAPGGDGAWLAAEVIRALGTFAAD